MVRMKLTPRSAQASVNRTDLKAGPLSVTSSSGAPNWSQHVAAPVASEIPPLSLTTMRRHRAAALDRAFLVRVMPRIIRVRQSIAATIHHRALPSVSPRSSSSSLLKTARSPARAMMVMRSIRHSSISTRSSGREMSRPRPTGRLRRIASSGPWRATSVSNRSSEAMQARIAWRPGAFNGARPASARRAFSVLNAIWTSATVLALVGRFRLR